MQSMLRQTLLKLRSQCSNDDTLILEIEKLAKQEGPIAIQHTFHLLGDVDLPLSECYKHWHNLLDHRQDMMGKLNRPVNLTTVFCDYLQHTTHFLDHPRIIETARYENAVRKSHYDTLTGLFNRSYFDEAYSQQVALAKRYTEEFTVLFLDIDNFKAINDDYGHHSGDTVLKTIAEIITQEKRDSDLAARFGGEEFIILLTHSDNISSYVFAERLRKKIADHKFSFSGTSKKITVSGGLASFPFNSVNPEELIEMADSAMYISKGAGKNRISHYKYEKRRYIRVKIEEQVLSTPLDFSNTPPHNGTSKDICVGGILFENDKALLLGSLISVQIQLAQDQDPVILIGYVVRVELLESGKYDIGMTTSFKELDDIVNKEIASIIPCN